MARREPDTQGAEDVLQGAQNPDQAEATGAAPADDGADTLAGGITPPADPAPDTVRAATAASTILHDGALFREGDLVPLTQAAFAALVATGALVEADWDDCAGL